MDYIDDAAHDLLGEIGFMYAVRQLLRIREGGLAFFGMPCNSFSWMSSSQHQRCLSSPFGNAHYGWVWAGNILGARMCLLLALCVARGVKFFVENPMRSSLPCFPYLAHILSFKEVGPIRVHWWGSQH